ncbi:MAG TPA: hypothetical protein VM911_21800 [Pyrinomonadaceae bacterium]|jgi:hypothetical protein|nr:hypothetical protein [Pyrinomonadaceae bacterium]
MAQATATRLDQDYSTTSGKQPDAAESMLKTVDETTVQSTGISLFHILTLGSIGASIALFLSGKKEAGIFIGLWPPTFQALKSVVDKKKNQ